MLMGLSIVSKQLVTTGMSKTILRFLDFDGLFHLFSRCRKSEYRESDGIVALTLNVNYDQLSTNAQRQKLTDALNVIVGNNTNVRTHLESIRPLPGENATEVTSVLLFFRPI